MLTCLPKSICSWDYRVLGTASGPAEVTFGVITKPGIITLGPECHAARKHGWCSGKWTLEHGGKVEVEARQPRLLLRHYELRGEGGEYSLQAKTAFRGRYDLTSGGVLVGSIWPAHAFTKRAFIQCDPAVPELTQLFAFWLAALTWRETTNVVATS